uniref:Uncharacterized protein n=1 Tax=Leersia perrieri TaxID=77586 RepID=A0A0D9WQ91_9ORYZ
MVLITTLTLAPYKNPLLLSSATPSASPLPFNLLSPPLPLPLLSPHGGGRRQQRLATPASSSFASRLPLAARCADLHLRRRQARSRRRGGGRWRAHGVGRIRRFRL